MFRFLVVVFFAAASASGDVTYDGPCPDSKPMENFNFASYAGKWYEIKKFPNAAEEYDKGKCTTAEYTVDGTKGTVTNTHVVDGVKSYIKGNLDLLEDSTIRLTYTFGGRSKYSYLKVLDTDYKTYAIGYSCKYFKDSNKHQIFSWVMSRTPTLEGAAKETVDNYLKNSKLIETAKYVENDHSDATCKATETLEIKKFID